LSETFAIRFQVSGIGNKNELVSIQKTAFLVLASLRHPTLRAGTRFRNPGVKLQDSIL